jgi:Protein of unknown function (DUF3618)
VSEIPERIEREMFEIRSRMASDVQDLRQHVNPKVVSKQVSTKIRDRIRGTVTRAGRSLLGSARRQANAFGEVRRKGDPSALTDAVKSDPRPLILLAIALAATLMAARKISNGREA